MSPELYKKLYENVPPCKFQQESLLVQLNLSIGIEVIDWDWGEKFNLAGYNKDRKALAAENRMF